MLTLLLTTSLALAAEFGPYEEDDVLPPGEVTYEEADTGAPVGCSDQYLHDGVQLPDMPHLFYRQFPTNQWGTQDMIDLLVDTAKHMRWLMPDASKIVYGDIAHKHGGFLSGHKSHRGGIDADVGIFRAGRWQADNRFTTLRSTDIDVEATWAEISFMLDTGKVDFILLDRHLIARIKNYTLENGLLSPEEAERIFPSEGSRRIWRDTGVVHHAPSHADHLHVRVLCPDGTKAR